MALPPQTRVSYLTLATARPEKLTNWYTSALGLTIHAQNAEYALLGGPDGAAFLTLKQEGDALPRPAFATGLYHFAILLPTRLALAQTLAHLVQTGAGLSGASDPAVSEALSLNDPDGNGVEVTRDRPRDPWQWQDGLLGITVDPLDLSGLPALVQAAGEPWPGMPPGTARGHVHLPVRNVGETAAFYQSLLGFDATARYPGALFVSASGDHHHFGADTWQSRNAPAPPASAAGLCDVNAPAPPASAAGLCDVSITLPPLGDMDALAARLHDGGWEFVPGEKGEIILVDPSGNKLRIGAE